MATKKKVEEPTEDVIVEVEDVIVETEEVTDEVEEGFTAADIPAADPQYVIAGDGDSYASFGARFCPEGKRPGSYARELYALNAGAVMRPGSRVRLY